MQDYAILGSDVTLKIKQGGVYKELLCAESCEFTVSTEQVLKTTVGNGRGIKRAVRRIEWGISYSGVNLITSGSTGIYPFDLLDIDTIISGYEIELGFYDPDGNGRVITGRVFLNSATLTGNVDEFSDSDFDMQGDGIYTITNVTASGLGIGWMTVGSTFIIG